MKDYVETLDGVHYICLEMMLVDKFRVFANPSAYNRLTKEFKRLEHFIDHVNIKKFVKGVQRNNARDPKGAQRNNARGDLKGFFLQHILDAHEGMNLAYAIVAYKDNLISILTTDYEQMKTLLVGAAAQKYKNAHIVVTEYSPLFFVSDGKLTMNLPDGLTVEIHKVEDNVYNFYKDDIDVGASHAVDKDG